MRRRQSRFASNQGPCPDSTRGQPCATLSVHMSASLDESLSVKEEAELMAFLDAHKRRMPLETCLGFFTALASIPQVIPPSVWLQQIIGKSRFRRGEDPDRIVGFLIRYYNICMGAVANEPAVLCPHQDDEISITCFCQGYAAGLAAFEGVDSESEKGDFGDLMIAIMLLSDPKPAKARRGVEIDTVTMYRLAREALPAVVEQLFEYWRPARDALCAEAAPAERAPAPSRNDPCPCGSGKKFKRCCMP